MQPRLIKAALLAGSVALGFSTSAGAGPVAPAPLVPFASTGDLFMQIDGIDGLARVNPTTGTASLFISDAQLQAAAAAAGTSIGTSFSQTNLAFDQTGNLYFSTFSGNNLYRRDANGQLSVLTTQAQLRAVATGTSFAPGGVAFGNDGFLYVADRNSGSTAGDLLRIDPMTGTPTQFRSRAQFLATAGISSLNWDGGIVGHGNGKIYIASEGGNPRGIIEVDLTSATAVALTATSPAGVVFGQPTFVTVGPNGNLFVANNGSGLQGILEIDPTTGTVTQFLTEAQITSVTGLGTAGEQAGIAFDDAGNFYMGDANSDSLLKFAVANPTTNPVAGAGMILTPNATLDALDLGSAALRGGIAFAPANVTIADTTFVMVSEPGALALFGLGLAGIGFAARRKRKTV